MIGTSELALGVSILVLVFSAGGLLASWLNRRQIASLKRIIEHTDRNARMVRVAVQAQAAKAAAEPLAVTIVNSDNQPVPVEQVGSDRGERPEA